MLVLVQSVKDLETRMGYVGVLIACAELEPNIGACAQLMNEFTSYRLGEIEAKSRKEGKEMHTKLTKLESTAGARSSARFMHL